MTVNASPPYSGYSGGYFFNAGNCGYWWSATEYDAYYAWSRDMDDGSKNVYRNDSGKTRLFSVRCVAD